jgi:hypothetical protein
LRLGVDWRWGLRSVMRIASIARGILTLGRRSIFIRHSSHKWLLEVRFIGRGHVSSSRLHGAINLRHPLVLQVRESSSSRNISLLLLNLLVVGVIVLIVVESFSSSSSGIGFILLILAHEKPQQEGQESDQGNAADHTAYDGANGCGFLF